MTTLDDRPTTTTGSKPTEYKALPVLVRPRQAGKTTESRQVPNIADMPGLAALIPPAPRPTPEELMRYTTPVAPTPYPLQIVPNEYTGDRLLAWAILSQAQRRHVDAERIRQEVFGRQASRGYCYCSPSRGAYLTSREAVRVEQARWAGFVFSTLMSIIGIVAILTAL